MKLLAVSLCLLVVAYSAEASHRQAKTNFRMEKEKQLATNEISQFLNTKNIVKTIVKLVFGNSEESSATSRHVLNLLVKVLDMLKTQFTQRNARSSPASVRGIKESVDDAAAASLSMFKGLVRSVLSTDQKCTQRHICEAASQASRESRELGYLIAQFGGYVQVVLTSFAPLTTNPHRYASSYILDSQKSIPFNANYDAARMGRAGGDCRKVYNCSEQE